MKNSSHFYHIGFYQLFNSFIVNFTFIIIIFFIYDIYYLITLVVQQPIKM